MTRHTLYAMFDSIPATNPGPQVIAVDEYKIV